MDFLFPLEPFLAGIEMKRKIHMAYMMRREERQACKGQGQGNRRENDAPTVAWDGYG